MGQTLLRDAATAAAGRASAASRDCWRPRAIASAISRATPTSTRRDATFSVSLRRELPPHRQASRAARGRSAGLRLRLPIRAAAGAIWRHDRRPPPRRRRSAAASPRPRRCSRCARTPATASRIELVAPDRASLPPGRDRGARSRRRSVQRFDLADARRRRRRDARRRPRRGGRARRQARPARVRRAPRVRRARARARRAGPRRGPRRRHVPRPARRRRSSSASSTSCATATLDDLVVTVARRRHLDAAGVRARAARRGRGRAARAARRGSRSSRPSAATLEVFGGAGQHGRRRRCSPSAASASSARRAPRARRPARACVSPTAATVAADHVIAVPGARRPPASPASRRTSAGSSTTRAFGRVEGLTDVYAAGDMTSFPVKQGGLAAQQADAIAAVDRAARRRRRRRCRR